MPVDTLLRPDNRLLALGTGDFSMFGAQPTSTISFAVPDISVAAQTSVENAGQGNAPVHSPDADTSPTPPLTTDAAPPPDAPDSTPVSSFASPAAAPATITSVPEPLTPVSGGSTGSVILNPPPVTPPDGSSVSDQVAPVGAVANMTGSQLFATAAPLVSGIASTTSLVTQAVQVDALLSTAGAAVAATTTLTQDTLASAVTTTEAALDVVSDTIETIVPTATAAVGGTLASAIDTPLTSAVTDTAQQATGSITSTAAQATGDIAGTVTETAGVLVDTLTGDAVTPPSAIGAVTGTVAAAAEAPALDIDSVIFSGSDPAGGIATLIDMVQTSELFTIGQAPAPVPVVEAGGSIVDDLIADAAPPVPILGEDSPVHDPVDDVGSHLGL